MTRNSFDQIAKQIAQSALEPCGVTTAQYEISSEPQYADLMHEPDPARTAERRRLGLLGRLAAVPCMIEVYSHAPSGEEFRACLAKHLAVWRERMRKARKSDSFLWILSAGTPVTLLQQLELEPSPQWPRGIYLLGDDALRVGFVVANELPRDRTSLLLRLMAGSRLLTSAIPEVAALPPDAFERTTAEPILLKFQHLLGEQPTPNQDEQEYLMAMLKSWEEGKAEARAAGREAGLAEGREEGRVEGREAGRAEGREAGRAEALLTVLQARNIAVTEAARARIAAETDRARLEHWLRTALTAKTIEDVLG